MAPTENEQDNSEDISMARLEKDVGFPKRYVLALMVFLGFSVLYALRVNLNVAIGAMCNNHTIYENGFYVTKVSYINIYIMEIWTSTMHFDLWGLPKKVNFFAKIIALLLFSCMKTFFITPMQSQNTLRKNL